MRDGEMSIQEHRKAALFHEQTANNFAKQGSWKHAEFEMQRALLHATLAQSANLDTHYDTHRTF